MSISSAVIPIIPGIGNALMAIPLVRQLKTRAKVERITVAALNEPMAAPFRRMAEVDEVILIDPKKLGKLGSIRAIRALRSDLLVMPFPSGRLDYSVMAFLSGAKRVLIHDYPVGQLKAMRFLNRNRLMAERGVHDVEQNLRLLRMIEVEPDLTEAPRFEVKAEDEANADALLGKDRDFIAIHFGSAKTVLAEAKRWPPEQFAKLIVALQSEFDLPIKLLEGPDEKGLSPEILQHLPSNTARPPVLQLLNDLGTSAAALKRAMLYVGSDSGLAHLSAAVGTPPVTLFGPAEPVRVAPFGYADLVVPSRTTCNPCFLYPWEATRPVVRCGQQGRPLCITTITVDDVMQRVRRAMSRIGQPI